MNRNDAIEYVKIKLLIAICSLMIRYLNGLKGAGSVQEAVGSLEQTANEIFFGIKNDQKTL